MNSELNKKKPRNLRDALKEKLNEKEMQLLQTSFDSFGNTAVIEIPDELLKKEKLIGEALLSINKHFQAVYRKKGKTEGEFRVLPLKLIAGKPLKKAEYRESNALFRISLGKVFFSPRLSTERLRISKKIKKNEVIGALFAGVGPFPIVFAKNSEMSKAYAVELNPQAVKDMEENIKLNKCSEKIIPIEGDVNKVVPMQLKGLCDRVVMPIPKTGNTFLNSAIDCLKKKGGVIHFYFFGSKEKPFDNALKEIDSAIKEKNKKKRILFKKIVRPFSPTTVQVVIDFKVY
ncbi:MAG: class I SAM-dependent methyltransferase family protein [Candidatus Diapherotrites archaeon]|nr:class I SAM-dependent methyltransferase family protein [Candidatus Diapherotrites archaeon]